jgi:hypothetical protein
MLRQTLAKLFHTASIGALSAPTSHVALTAREPVSNATLPGHKLSLAGTLRTMVSGLLMSVMLLVAVPTLAAIAGPTLKLNIIQSVDASSCVNLGISYGVPAGTTSTTITINYSGFTCTGSSSNNYTSVYALMSRTDPTFNSPSAYSRWTYLGTKANVASPGAFAMDLTGGGHYGVAQGSNTYYLDITLCTLGNSNDYGWQTYAYANLPGGVCTLVSNPGAVSRSVTYDSVAPSVSGSAPNTTSHTVVVNSSASDATSGVYSTSGWIYGGGTWWLCGTLGGTSGTFYCGVGSDGTYTVGVSSVDNFGNDSGIAWQSTVGVDATGPSTPSVTPSSTLSTNTISGTVTWSASSDNYSGTQGYYVDYRWATLSNGTCINVLADSGWIWLGNTTSWGPGWGSNTCFQYQIVAKDNYGNWGGASGWSGWIVSDEINPTFNGSLNAANFIPGQTVILTQSGSTDSNPSSGLKGVYCYMNNGVSCSAWVSTNSASYTVPTPTVGTQANYTISGTAQDNSGNWAYSNYTYCVDNTHPTGLSLSGVPTSTNTAIINVTTHSTAGGCAGVTNVAISNNGTSWLYGEPANGIVSWDITNATYGGSSAQGTHTIYVTFFEGTTWNQISTTVSYDTVAPSAPSAPILAVGSDIGNSHTDGLTSIANGLVFTGSAEANSTVKIYNGGTLLGTGTATSGGAYSVTTTSPLAGGVYAITVKATDTAGNISPISAVYTVVIHTTCPA